MNENVDRAKNLIYIRDAGLLFILCCSYLCILSDWRHMMEFLSSERIFPFNSVSWHVLHFNWQCEVENWKYIITESMLSNKAIMWYESKKNVYMQLTTVTTTEEKTSFFFKDIAWICCVLLSFNKNVGFFELLVNDEFIQTTINRNENDNSLSRFNRVDCHKITHKLISLATSHWVKNFLCYLTALSILKLINNSREWH